MEEESYFYCPYCDTETPQSRWARAARYANSWAFICPECGDYTVQTPSDEEAVKNEEAA